LGEPLVSVITATWGRPRTILEHAIPSVAAQDYPAIEHLIVTDGHDPGLNQVLAGAGYASEPGRARRLVCLGRNWSAVHGDGGVGATARQVGCCVAAGDWITYLDDDDGWLPHHVSAMVACGEQAEADLVCSAWLHGPRREVRGSGPPRAGQTGTSMMMHRPSLLKVSGWRPEGYCADGWLAERWVAGGARWAFHPEPTVILRGHNHGAADPPGGTL
jgi:glycosyltransferase involved in cell wall biosynthesis